VVTEFLKASPRQLQMHRTATSFRGRVGALVRALLAETQFDPELAKAFCENWTLPRHKLVVGILEEAIGQGGIRSHIDVEAAINLSYAPMYYRLQMGTGPIFKAYKRSSFLLLVWFREPLYRYAF